MAAAPDVWTTVAGFGGGIGFRVLVTRRGRPRGFHPPWLIGGRRRSGGDWRAVLRSGRLADGATAAVRCPPVIRSVKPVRASDPLAVFF